MLRKTILSVLLLAVVGIQAQELKVKNFEPLPNDKTAVKQPCQDNNNKNCALIKIRTDNVKGFVFPREDHYKELYNENEKSYFIYLSVDYPKLYIDHPDYHGISINFDDFDVLEEGLEEGKTYSLTLDVPATVGNTMIVIKVQPTSAKLFFNNEYAAHSPEGIYKFPVSPDTYNYSIQADDYTPTKGSVSVEKGETKTVTKRLVPIMHEVNVNCNVGGAQIYVDNVTYGTVGKVRLPQGRHTIRIQKEGYIDCSEDVTISSNTGTISFNLKKNKNVKEIHATPVTIYSKSNSTKIYKNYKVIKEWKNGATIMFMPGKYLLTDDKDNEYELKVSDKPITVRF